MLQTDCHNKDKGEFSFSRMLPNDLFYFLAASNAYSRKDELLAHGNPDTWLERKRHVWIDLVDKNDSKFQWDESFSDIVFLLFPAVKSKFDDLISQLERERKC